MPSKPNNENFGNRVFSPNHEEKIKPTASVTMVRLLEGLLQKRMGSRRTGGNEGVREDRPSDPPLPERWGDRILSGWGARGVVRPGPGAPSRSRGRKAALTSSGRSGTVGAWSRPSARTGGGRRVGCTDPWDQGGDPTFLGIDCHGPKARPSGQERCTPHAPV